MKYNPFKPGNIIHPGMFAGRAEELIILEKFLFQTAQGNDTNFLLHGERGIGKSSLLLYLDAIAKGDLSGFEGCKFNFLVLSIILEPTDQYPDVILKICRELKRQLDRNEKFKTSMKSIWDFISNWEILGVKYNKEKVEEGIKEIFEELINELVTILTNKKQTSFDGIYLFIDEADKPCNNPNLGSLVKYLTERINQKGANRFGIGVIGLSSVIEKLKESHPSSPRIFQFIELMPLKPNEMKQVIDLGVKEANSKNEKEVVFQDDAKAVIIEFSEGYPHFLQQYAYSAFETDNDFSIDFDDLYKSLIGKNGALHQLGERYFDNMYYKEIGSLKYREILQIMARHDEEYITKKLIMSHTGFNEKIVQNAITAFQKKGFILSKKGVRGCYKLASKSFKLWIYAYARVEELKQNKK